MKLAALIFLAAGAGVVAWAIALLAAGGIAFSKAFWVACGIGMMYLAYSLWRRRPRARKYALAVSAVMTLVAAFSSTMFAADAWPIASMPAHGWTTLVLFAAVVVAFGMAFVLLLADRSAPRS